MIVKIGNIFESSAQTLVNTVNCVGVMSKGIALDFKNKYPAMFSEYVELCKSEKVKPGVPYYYSDLSGTSIINFPTKNHWRSPSKLSYIIDGLNWFRDNYCDLGITSIAFPPLGCGNGGLPWTVVGPVMYEKLHDLPIDIEIYAPYGTKPEELTESFLSKNIIHSAEDVIGNQSLPFNKYWLLILYVVQKLNNDRYSLNVGRTIFRKVCYILTRTGVPTGFNFIEGSYGPYSKEVKDAVTVLSNANLMSERQLGKMVETVVSPDFKLQEDQFTEQDIKNADQAFDLLSRIRSTDQAEMVATVLFSFDELLKQGSNPKDVDVFNHILKWKPRWKNQKEDEISDTILSLSSLGWMNPIYTGELASADDALYA
ncbi:MAG: macro domain-containing protein [Oscillospiraceae bacterium]|nr:macro domain-containing protein [Oscillospiraceae bacterium]